MGFFDTKTFWTCRGGIFTATTKKQSVFSYLRSADLSWRSSLSEPSTASSADSAVGGSITAVRSSIASGRTSRAARAGIDHDPDGARH